MQTRLGGGYTGALELGDPGTIKIVMTDAGVNILDHCLVNLVGVIRQHSEYQPGWTVDMDLCRNYKIMNHKMYFESPYA